ncbi:MAG: IS630 family transposase [Candidatus Saccharimonadales bacterium]
MLKTNISDTEKIHLREYAKTAPLLLVRLKAQTILMASKNNTVADMADIQGRAERTILGWLKDWSQRRLASLFTGHQDNTNAAELTPEQRAGVKRVLASPPHDAGIPGSFWDVPKLKSYLEVNFGVVYESERTYHFLLKFSNLSFKYPDTFDRKRDLGFIEARMRQIHAEITPLLTNKDWEVFTVDEVRMEQEAITRRAWLKRGERTIIKVNRNKESQSYIGFLNQRSFKCEVYEMPWQNQDEVLKAFEQFLRAHPNKKIAIIWDNAAFHKGQKIRAALAKGQLLERVHLIPMPPYAPDHNPIEHVWNTTKQAVANIQHHTFEQTKTAFTDYIAGRLFKYAV